MNNETLVRADRLREGDSFRVNGGLVAVESVFTRGGFTALFLRGGGCAVVNAGTQLPRVNGQPAEMRRA